MALEKCPHMTARCPHYRRDCNDAASKDCHHRKSTTAGLVTVVASLHMFGVERLSPATMKYFQEAEAFLEDMGILP